MFDLRKTFTRAGDMNSIGNSSFFPPCILAPLAGVSDLPFRMLNRKFGCRFAFTSMVSASSLVYRNRLTEKMLATVSADKPLGIQLFGEDPGIIQAAMDLLKKYDFDVIDLNAACPVKKVTSKGFGASLLKSPARLSKILKVMVDSSEVPVTVKIRTGWDSSNINARDVALFAQDSGIKGLFIHGRTRNQGYGGSVNYQVIGEVKDALDIPVIGSGNALTPVLIKKMFDETGCDSVAIARGALGNPWIFNQTDTFLSTGTVPREPELEEIESTMINHLNQCAEFYGEKAGVVKFRKIFAWYTKGFRNIKADRTRAFKAENKTDMICVINDVCFR